MGLCPSSLTEDEKQAIEQSTAWDKDLLGEHTKDQKIIKLLLLGTGESGKSTIFKQMQILYEDGFSEFEKLTFRHVIRRNAVESMQTLLAAAERFRFPLENPNSRGWAQYLASVDPHAADFWDPRIVDCIHALWPNEGAIIKTYENRARIQLLDSTEYLFTNIDRIGQADYSPSANDILRARLRTSGIVERMFKIHNVMFKFLDVGGQRNERRKWIHCFEGVTSIIFVAAISEYDQVLYEDERENRLREAITVFGDICNNDCFDKTAMILFLNKIDLFKMKLPHAPLTICFPEYKGDNSLDNAAKFIEERFNDVNQKEKMIFTHLTCATDTDNVERVFEACKLVILKENLERLGLT